MTKQWTFDTRYCWYDTPFLTLVAPIDSEVYWTYLIQLSMYFSLLITLFIDERRKASRGLRAPA